MKSAVRAGVIIFLLLICGCRGPATMAAPVLSSAKNLLGINLRFATSDWDEDRMFADMMKTARMWHPFTPNGPNLANPAEALYDSNFWPLEDACLVIADLANKSGTYQCKFTGQAQLVGWVYGSLGTISPLVYDSGTNTTTFSITIDHDIMAFSLCFQGTVRNPSDPNSLKGITNLQIMRPVAVGSTQSYPFGTKFTDQVKALVAPFAAIRFMDYLSTNSNPVQNWADRTLPTDASQSSEYRQLVPPASGGVFPASWAPGLRGWPVGGCYEYAIALSNETHKDLWVNVPLFATDDYVHQLAQLISTNLDPSLNVYVEYSNEVWNTAGGFFQGNQNNNLAGVDQTQGHLPSLADPGDTGPTNWSWAFKRVARRIVEISNDFRVVFGDAAMPAPGKVSPRVRPVYEWQQGNTWWESTGLMFIDNNFSHPANYYLYGMGGSAYYNPDNNSPGLNTETLWTSQTMDPAQWASVCTQESLLAHSFGLKRIAYEGGPSFDGAIPSNPTVDKVKDTAWGDPRMQQNLVDHVTKAWAATDSDLLMFYSTVADTAWGFTKSAFDLNTPKYFAIAQLNAQNKAAPTLGQVPPFTVPGTKADQAAFYRSGSWGDADNVMYIRAAAGSGGRAYISYAVRVLTAGNYTVTPVLAANPATPAPAVDLWCDGIYVATIPGGTKGPATPTTLTNLQPGLHGVVLKVYEGEMALQSVVFGKTP